MSWVKVQGGRQGSGGDRIALSSDCGYGGAHPGERTNYAAPTQFLALGAPTNIYYAPLKNLGIKEV